MSLKQTQKFRQEQERAKHKQFVENTRPVLMTIEDLETGKVTRRREPEYEKFGVTDHNQPKFGSFGNVKTLGDVLESLTEVKTRKFTKRRASRISKVLDEVIVSDQVRAYWDSKFNQAPLTSEERQKLINMAKPQLSIKPDYDELKLIALAEAIVRTWIPRNKLT